MAYYPLFMGNSLEEFLLQTISPFYIYTSQHELFRENNNPVIIEMLESDNVTKPPNPHIKRQQGRPKKKRLRTRCKYVDLTEPEIKCSICGDAGHNKKHVRQEKSRQQGLSIREEVHHHPLSFVNDDINRLL
jgi:hypothetical protein